MTFLKPQQREAQVKAEEAGEVYGEEGTMREMMAEAWEPMGQLFAGLDLPSPSGFQQIGAVTGTYAGLQLGEFLSSLDFMSLFGDKSVLVDPVLRA
jgi:hypothetical protein